MFSTFLTMWRIHRAIYLRDGSARNLPLMVWDGFVSIQARTWLDRGRKRFNNRTVAAGALRFLATLAIAHTLPHRGTGTMYK
jgi:hypothetical protein